MGMIDSISCGQARRLAKPIVLTTAANIVELAPFAFLTLVVAQIVSGAADIAAMWAACAAMGVLLVATFVVEHFAINASFSDGYKVSAESRTRLAEHIRKLPLGVLDEGGQARLTNTLMSDIAVTERGMTHVLPQVASGIAIIFSPAWCSLASIGASTPPRCSACRSPLSFWRQGATFANAGTSGFRRLAWRWRRACRTSSMA